MHPSGRRRRPLLPWTAPLCWATHCKSSLPTLTQVRGKCGPRRDRVGRCVNRSATELGYHSPGGLRNRQQQQMQRWHAGMPAAGEGCLIVHRASCTSCHGRQPLPSPRRPAHHPGAFWADPVRQLLREAPASQLWGTLEQMGEEAVWVCRTASRLHQRNYLDWCGTLSTVAAMFTNWAPCLPIE